MKTVHNVDDVFGVSRDLPLNYVTREKVDDKFLDCLSRDQHIVIYGSSKQGKTSLRKKCLNDDDYIVVSCQNRWTLVQLHSAILKLAGFQVKQSETTNSSGTKKIIVEAEASVGMPLFARAKGKMNAEGEKATGMSETHAPLELDPIDTNDIIKALKEIDFNKFIVLEDFHYLPEDTQRDFSFALKAFHEDSKHTFIIVGVWREENRLIAFNGDLTDRVLSVDVDKWDTESLRQVLNEGEILLNVEFEKDFVDSLLPRSFESVHIVQEACRRAVRATGIIETQDELKEIGDSVDVSAIVADVVSEHQGRYSGFLMNFADGFQQTELEMPKWIIYALLSSSVEELEEGIRLTRISKIIKSAHPRGQELNNGNITQILTVASSLQNKKNIRPLVIDYDGSNRNLHVVDKGFLIWLSSQNVNETLAELNLPDAWHENEP